MGFSLVAASLAGLVSLAIVLYFLKLVVGASIGDPRTLRDRLKLRGKKQILSQIDAGLNSNKIEQSIDLVRDAFFLDPYILHRSLLDQIANHHLELLARIVALSEKRSLHLSALPMLEDLLMTRADLLRAKFEVSQTKKGLHEKTLSSGQRTPEWALNEFSKKLMEINDRLNVNRRTIETQLRDLLHSLHGFTPADDVTVH